MAQETSKVEIDLPEDMSPEEVTKALATLLSKKPKKEKIDDSSKIFKKIEAGPEDEIRVSRDFYKGKEFLSIRKWYTDEEGTLKPGKGVTFQYEHIEEIMEGLTLMRDYLEEKTEGEE